jgi:hypothetical protein
MILKIPVPKVSFATNVVPLGGQSYNFTFRFNERSNRWKLDISTAEGEVVRNGLTLIEGTFPLSHMYTPNFLHGVIGVIQTQDGTDPAGRDNLGIGKQYELIYASVDELGA